MNERFILRMLAALESVGCHSPVVLSNPETQVEHALRHHERVCSYRYQEECKRQAISRSKKQARKAQKQARRNNRKG